MTTPTAVPTAAAPRLELRGVTKRFGARVAVDQLDLAVPPGEIFGLLGHNGAGKSTAIGMMLGQVWPTAGEVRVCGHDVQRHRHRALCRVGALFETPAFYDYLSGWRNLEILCQYTAPAPVQRLRDVVEWVGLTGRIQSRVKTYSHGMRARLALAQALLPGPELLILDEPADGLDPEGIHELRHTILRLHGEFGLTLLLSSHLLGEVEQLCTRIAVLKQGRKVFEGPLTEVKQAGRWVRLVTDDFPAAAALLQRAGLITGGTASGSDLHGGSEQGGGTRLLASQDTGEALRLTAGPSDPDPRGVPLARPSGTLSRPTGEGRSEGDLSRKWVGRGGPAAPGAAGRGRPALPYRRNAIPEGAGGFVESRQGGVLVLVPGRRISEVVEHLVAARHRVHEIAPEEQTLERFYLELMR